MRDRAQLDPEPRVWRDVRLFSFTAWLILALLWATPARLRAQDDSHQNAEQENAPGLQHRAPDADEDDPDIAGLQRGRTRLPREANGEYSLGKSGEVVEIEIQDGRLTGYISRLGDQSADKGTPLTYFFRLSTVHNGEITFTTRSVHGTWYSFAGEIVRGETEDDEDRGGYMLVGMLTEHTRDVTREKDDANHGKETETPTRVRLPHLPQHPPAGR